MTVPVSLTVALTPGKSSLPTATSVVRSSKPPLTFSSTRMTVSDSSSTRTAPLCMVTTPACRADADSAPAKASRQRSIGMRN